MRSMVIKGALWMANHLIELGHYHVSVDATCGNGNDTLKLAKRSELVYACDIQSEAIQIAQKKTRAYDHVRYFCISHEELAELIPEKIDLVVFNCGYLPGSDKRIMTDESSVIQALERFIPKLSSQGRIILVTYPGTERGLKEDRSIEGFTSQLSQELVDVFTFQHKNGRNMPAKLYIIQNNARITR